MRLHFALFLSLGIKFVNTFQKNADYCNTHFTTYFRILATDVRSVIIQISYAGKIILLRDASAIESCKGINSVPNIIRKRCY